MKGRRQSDKAIKPIVITLDDGSVVRCTVASIGRELQPRWMLMTGDGVQYAGPLATSDKSPEGVKRLISEWWTTKRDPGKPKGA
jgi:hypothetical protein